jgi:ferredoxin
MSFSATALRAPPALRFPLLRLLLLACQIRQFHAASVAVNWSSDTRDITSLLHLIFAHENSNLHDNSHMHRRLKRLRATLGIATRFLVHRGQLMRAGEHGTGRNVAPFVEMEWGSKAYELMWEIKGIFDPDFVLNPGVILNKDPDCHRKFFKPSPVASPIVDRCIECGFCESNCPSKDLSLTPRQRIAAFKEINRLRRLENPSPEAVERLKAFEKSYEYDGDATCAADGMCQQKCPVKINTGAQSDSSTYPVSV